MFSDGRFLKQAATNSTWSLIYVGLIRIKKSIIIDFQTMFSEHISKIIEVRKNKDGIFITHGWGTFILSNPPKTLEFWHINLFECHLLALENVTAIGCDFDALKSCLVGYLLVGHLRLEHACNDIASYLQIGAYMTLINTALQASGGNCNWNVALSIRASRNGDGSVWIVQASTGRAVISINAVAATSCSCNWMLLHVQRLNK